MRGILLDPYRLPQHVIPVRYDLRLEPDLTASTFLGEQTVTLTVRQATREIVLNAVELQVNAATLTNDSGVSLPGTITLEEKTERCRIAFPSLIAPGTWRLRLSFQGVLNDKLRGFYRSKYKDASGNSVIWRPPSLRPPTPAVPSRAGTSLRSRQCLPRPWSSIAT